MKIKHSVEKLKSALKSLDSLNTVDLVGEFRAFEHECCAGTFAALRLNPATGETWTTNDASWSCPADEYFSESGVLSTITLLSSTRAHWNPSPDEGFEWVDGNDYVHPLGDCDGWITAEEFEGLEDEEKARYTQWFAVGSSPVNGWVPDGDDDHDVRNIEQQIKSLREDIEEEIEQAEAESCEEQS